MMNMLYSTLLFISMFQHVLGHAGPAPVHWKRDNHAARDELQARCGSELLARREYRAEDSLLKRSLANKSHLPARRSTTNDSTCILTPEVTQGPYHILGEIVRQNITESQPGIPLELNVDFFDISTCKPVQVWVDAWSANATGYYAGYEASTGGAGGGFGPAPGGDLPSGSIPIIPGPSAISTSEGASSASVGPYDGADSPAAAAMLNTATTDKDTFLRGVWQSDENGEWTMHSVVPGWYTGRAVHFHIKVYPDGEIATNGTFVPTSNAVHTGQFFFDSETMGAVAATDIYAANAISWENATTNEADMWYPYQNNAGYTANVDVTWIGEHITDGLIGSISVGLNLSYASPELSTQVVDFDYAGYLASSLIPYASSSAAIAPASSSDAVEPDTSTRLAIPSLLCVGLAMIFFALYPN